MAYVVQALLNCPAMEQSQFPTSSPEDQLLTRYTKTEYAQLVNVLLSRSPTQRFQRVRQQGRADRRATASPPVRECLAALDSEHALVMPARSAFLRSSLGPVKLPVE